MGWDLPAADSTPTTAHSLVGQLLVMNKSGGIWSGLWTAPQHCIALLLSHPAVNCVGLAASQMAGLLLGFILSSQLLDSCACHHNQELEGKFCNASLAEVRVRATCVQVTEKALQRQPFRYDAATIRRADPNKRRRWLIPLVLAAQIAFKVSIARQ